MIVKLKNDVILAENDRFGFFTSFTSKICFTNISSKILRYLLKYAEFCGEFNSIFEISAKILLKTFHRMRLTRSLQYIGKCPKKRKKISTVYDAPPVKHRRHLDLSVFHIDINTRNKIRKMIAVLMEFFYAHRDFKSHISSKLSLRHTGKFFTYECYTQSILLDKPMTRGRSY